MAAAAARAGVAVTVAWCAVASFVILKAVGLVVPLRVDKDTEVAGLDITLHGEVVP